MKLSLRTQSSRPFPYWILDAEFDETDAAALSEWPSPSHGAWVEFSRHKKRMMNDKARMPTSLGRFIVRANEQFRAEAEKLSGIRDLMVDDALTGAGLHETRAGGSLAMHVDFNRLDHLYRRINVLLFLNDSWRPDDGGSLYLGMNRDVQIAPTLGTVVIFRTSNDSWHGHPDPVCGSARRSVALYYYTQERPNDYHERLETTLYVK